MDWIKASIKTKPDNIDAVFGILLMQGVTGAQIIDYSDLQKVLNENPIAWDYIDEALLENKHEEAFVEFYVLPGERDTLFKIGEALKRLSLSLVIETVSDESWLHEWKKHFKPLRLGKKMVVVPSWEAYNAAPDDLIISIDPGSAFGTGQHQTTQLCAALLEEFAFPGHTLLDIGCGSGILSIVGLCLGASHVLACDIDPHAIISTNENIERNKIDKSQVSLYEGNLLEDWDLRAVIAANPADIVVANIVADPIIALAPLVGGFLKPEGLFITSGIIAERVDQVQQAMKDNRFAITRSLERDGWFAMVAHA